MSDKPSAAAVYVRISKDTVALGLGVDRQRDLCAKLADRIGWTVTAVYEDNDISAYSGKRRPEYEAMCRSVRDGMHDGIVCVDQDRLTRHPRELEDIIDLGVDIAFDSGELDLTKSDDRFRARLFGNLARQESEKKSERIKREKDEARRKGRWVGRPPYGYVTVPGPDGGRKLEVEPEQARVVREMAPRALAGETLLSLSRWAKAETGETWTPTRVRRALTRPAVAGWQPHDGEVFRHPETGMAVKVTVGVPLLDEVTWAGLRRQFAGRRRTGISGRSEGVLLARLVFCAVCGHMMSWSSGSSYVCRTSHERGGECPGNAVIGHRVHALVDELVVATLERVVDPPPVPSAGGGELVRLGLLLEQQESERRRLLLDGASPERVSAVQTTIDEVDARLRAARVQLERETIREGRTLALAVLGPSPADHYRELCRTAVPARRDVIRALVRQVTVRPAGGRTSRFDPGRVDVELAL